MARGHGPALAFGARHRRGLGGLRNTVAMSEGPAKRVQFTLKSLLLATTLFAVATFLTIWSDNPGQYIIGHPWERRVLAKLFTLPIICGSLGAGVGLLIGRVWISLLIGLAVAATSSPFLFLWWLSH